MTMRAFILRDIIEGEGCEVLGARFGGIGISLIRESMAVSLEEESRRRKTGSNLRAAPNRLG
jgi:hypothetical protein